MNAWQIYGGIISIIGTGLMFWGSYIQAKIDQSFQNQVGGYVTEQKVFDAPNLAVLEINTLGNGTTSLKVRNIGKRPASDVKLIFTEDSVPSAFVSNLIPGAKEIPGSVDYVFPLHLFSGINLILKTPNSDLGYVDSLREVVRKYEIGEVALIPRFHLEYFDGQEKLTSPSYFLVINKNHQIYLGRD